MFDFVVFEIVLVNGLSSESGFSPFFGLFLPTLLFEKILLS